MLGFTDSVADLAHVPQVQHMRPGGFATAQQADLHGSFVNVSEPAGNAGSGGLAGGPALYRMTH